MKKIIIAEEISIKWLTRELQAAGVNVSSAGIERTEAGAFISAYVEIAEADEAAALVVIAAHDPNVNPDVLELADLQALSGMITNELAWLVSARADIATGIGVIDGGATLAQLRTVVKGLAQIVDRMAQEQDRELRAWRYVGRRLR